MGFWAGALALLVMLILGAYVMSRPDHHMGDLMAAESAVTVRCGPRVAVAAALVADSNQRDATVLVRHLLRYANEHDLTILAHAIDTSVAAMYEPNGFVPVEDQLDPLLMYRPPNPPRYRRPGIRPASTDRPKV